MDEALVKLIIAAVVALVSSLATYQATATSKEGDIERLSRQAEKYETDFRRAKEKLDGVNAEITKLETKNAELVASYESLEDKFNLCTSSVGKTVVTHPTSAAWAQSRVTTGDTLRFKLAASSLLLKVVRVTRDGPVVRIDGCRHPSVLDGVSSSRDGEHSYLLAPQSTLSLSVSTDCCERGLVVCSMADMEQIDVVADDYDLDQQAASVSYRKTLIGLMED